MTGTLAEQGVAQDLSWCANFAEEMIPTRGEAERLLLVWEAVQTVLRMRAYMESATAGGKGRW